MGPMETMGPMGLGPMGSGAPVPGPGPGPWRPQAHGPRPMGPMGSMDPMGTMDSHTILQYFHIFCTSSGKVFPNTRYLSNQA